MSIFSQKETNKIIAIFDISSSAVSVALISYPFKKEKVGKPSIIFQFKREIKENKDFDFNSFLRNTLKALEECSRELLNFKNIAPEKIICNLSSPWVTSQNRSIVLEKQSPFKFTKKIADDLIKKELEIDFKKTIDFVNHKDIELIERKTTQVKLNGYQTSNPFEKRIKHVEISSFISAISSSTKKEFEKIIEKDFAVPIEFHSSLFNTFYTFKNEFLNKKDAMILDISGELTEIILIRNGLIDKILSFPFAENSFVRSVSKSINIPTIHKTHSLIRSFLGNNLDEEYSRKIKPSLDNARIEWANKFREAINELSIKNLLPGVVFISSDSEIGNWIFETLKYENFENYIIDRSFFTVVNLKDFEWKKLVKIKDNKINIKLITGAFFAKFIIK